MTLGFYTKDRYGLLMRGMGLGCPLSTESLASLRISWVIMVPTTPACPLYQYILMVGSLPQNDTVVAESVQVSADITRNKQ